MKAKPQSHGLSASGMRVAIVAARFNDGIVRRLLDGAHATLLELGADSDDVMSCRVPGAFELPLAAKALAVSGAFDGIVALGAVIRGETPHFDYVAGECIKGISMASQQHGVPVGFGVLTVDTIEQAIERAGTKAGNKGEEATMAVIEMVNLLRRID